MTNMCVMKNKEILKYLDRFHSELAKEYDEDKAAGMINDIIDTSFIPYLCINLRMGSGDAVAIIYKCAKTVKQFRESIYEHIVHIVMSSLMYAESMKVAMQIYDDANISTFANKFNDEMIIAIYKHALLFPENKEACMDCIRKHITPKLALERPFLYLGDEVDILQKHFSKDKKTRDDIYRLCLDSDASKTFIKALRYNKSHMSLISKLSVPTFKENIGILDLTDPFTRLQIYDEATTFSRWDYLPFIFEELRPVGKEWEMFSIGLYQTYINKTFLEILIYYMKKYDIPIETLKNPKNASLICSDEIADVLKKYGLTGSFKIMRSQHINTYYYTDITNLFFAFQNRNYKFITDFLHLSNANLNIRFIRERAHTNSLIINDKLGWSNDIRVQWIAFIQFTDGVIDELNVVEKVLAKFNSFHAISHMIDAIIGMRLINDLSNHFRIVKNKHILDSCIDFTNNIKFYREQMLKEVREIIGIDLPVDQEWTLPSSPTLEDYFKYLYQYSNFGNDSYEEGLELINKLKDKGFVKIAEECYISLTKFIPLEDIIGILRDKSIYI